MQLTLSSQLFFRRDALSCAIYGSKGPIRSIYGPHLYPTVDIDGESVSLGVYMPA